MFPAHVKLSDIQSNSAKAVIDVSDWLAKQPEGRLIIQEKLDGSNMTIYRKEDGAELCFFNKGKHITLDKQQNSTFSRTCDALRKRAELFLPGYIYHGEAMKAARANHIMYQRIPKFHWICFEIIKPDGTNATPEEMTEILGDTGLEQAHIYYDSIRANEESAARLEKLFQNIDTLFSSLGNYAEGFVVKVLNREKKGKIVTSRRKYVASHMRERKLIPGVASPDCTIEAIGDMFNVAARHRKAVQHLEERGEEVTYQALVDEADADLEKEYYKEVQDILMQRYWPVIKRAARKDLAKNLGLEMFKK